MKKKKQKIYQSSFGLILVVIEMRFTNYNNKFIIQNDNQNIDFHHRLTRITTDFYNV